MGGIIRPRPTATAGEIIMDLEFFEKIVLVELYQGAYFYTDIKKETDTEYIYTITIGTDFFGYEEYNLYFDKKTKKLKNFQKNTWQQKLNML